MSERGHAVGDEEEKTLFLEGVMADISEQKEADELKKTMPDRWRRTLDAIPQMGWRMAGDGSEEFHNAQWLHFTGCRIDETEGLSGADLVDIDDQFRVMALWNEKFAKGEPYEAHYRLKHVAGDHRWILSRGEPEKDATGNVIRWYVRTSPQGGRAGRRYGDPAWR